jgi:polyketide cyclase/dehydrase/lipid transport protein
LVGLALLPPDTYSIIARATVASICKQIVTKARTNDVWSAIRDVGALHTRLVPGFVTDTRIEPGARIVTFGNGMVLREPINAVDDKARRLVWSAEGGRFTHYNASLQVFAEERGGSRVVWIADFLPDAAASDQHAAMETALQIMKTTLDRFAEEK